MTSCPFYLQPQVGSFPNWDVWAEWNGMFRDDIRRFIKGDMGECVCMSTLACAWACTSIHL